MLVPSSVLVPGSVLVPAPTDRVLQHQKEQSRRSFPLSVVAGTSIVSPNKDRDCSFLHQNAT